jgi:adenylate kinase
MMVIYLKVKEKVSIERLASRGRTNPDGSLHDSPQNIRERLRRYHSEEKDVLEFYKKAGVLQEVNGQRSIETIHKDLVTRVKNLIKNNKENNK